MSMRYNEPDPRYWRVNYPIIYKDTIIIAPKDSDYIMSLNRKDGRLKWKRPMPDLRYIAGIDGRELFCLAGTPRGERLIVLDADNKKELYTSPDDVRLSTPVGPPGPDGFRVSIFRPSTLWSASTEKRKNSTRS